MTPSLKHLLDDIIDYAGLFPPAALPMEEAVEEYRTLLACEESWIVNRFVCPVGWLEDFRRHQESGLVAEPWQLTVLGSSIEGFRQDLRQIEAFEQHAGSLVQIDAYEVKSNGQDLTASNFRHLSDAGFEEVYVELPWDDAMMDNLVLVAETEVIGAKARTGGLEASAFPRADRLAAFIQECINLDLQYKLTAGLHHPLPRPDSISGAMMHGFVNVTFAGLIAYVHDLNRVEIEQVLASTNKDDFWFSAKGLGYRDFEASLEEIEEFRQQFTSFGSCSVEEPLADLEEIGWA